MTIWQSLALVSPAQWAYAAGLAALFAWRGPSFIAWVLLADFVVILAIAAAMDFGIASERAARISMLIVWIASAAILVTQPGAARVIAAISAGTVLIFSACLLFNVQFGTTSAIVNALAFIMLAVAAHGTGDIGGGRRGHSDMPLPVGVSVGNHGMAAGGLARRADVLSQDRRVIR